jgi:hypothetical protein
MNAKEFVDSLLTGYEETEASADFKEELLSNLNAKIESFQKKGMDAQAAFEKASAELGDVSALADELSQRKRKEVFEDAYMDIRAYMTPGRVAAYVVFGALALFGITIALITFFATKKVGSQIGLIDNIDFTAFFSVMMPFLTAAVVGFTYLGMTQETASMYPVSKKRGGWYAAAAGLIAFGLFMMPVVFFSGRIAGDIIDNISGATIPYLDGVKVPELPDIRSVMMIVPVFSMLIPFVLPGIGILVYLCLTEKNRLKPWAKDFHKKAVKQEMEMWINYESAARFGVFSGAIWIFAVGIFILLGFLIGFKFSWLVFIFAVAIQLLVQGFMSKPR